MKNRILFLIGVIILIIAMVSCTQKPESEKHESTSEAPTTENEMEPNIHNLYQEFLEGRIAVENPFNPDFPITSYNEVFYWQDGGGTFPMETLEKKFALVDVNNDQTEELIFKISSGLDELMYILGICDGSLKVYDVFETHTNHIGFNVYDNGFVYEGQNYDGDETVYYQYSKTGERIEVIDFTSSEELMEPKWHHIEVN